MKSLVIGIDGGDEDIFSAMDSKYLSDFFNKHNTLNIEEDLWNRGWASILSGSHGFTTGGFYSKPRLDGTHDFEQSFGTNDYKDNVKIAPLWEKVNDCGLDVGFMNVKTTMPAPEVDGFFVSGAGGGYKPSGGVPKKACYPESIHNFLKSSDYNWEIRFLDSGIKDIFEYINLVTHTIEERTDAYLHLCEKYDPSFGFVSHTETVGIQNLCMSEINPLMNSDISNLNELQREIRGLYQSVDDSIKTIVEELNPENIIIVSDHGQAAYKYSINADAFLKRIGMQPSVSSTEQKSRTLIRGVGERTPKPIRNLASSLLPSIHDKATRPDIDWDNALAFGHRYVPGIYINDSRFSGPVSDEEYDKIVSNIVTKLNESEEATKYDLKASAYRQKYPDAYQNKLLPDIWIDKPETMFFEGKGEFVQPNKDYRSILDQDLNNVDRNMHTGKKGKNPIVSYNYDVPNIDKNEVYDLTTTHEIIMKSIKKDS